MSTMLYHLMPGIFTSIGLFFMIVGFFYLLGLYRYLRVDKFIWKLSLALIVFFMVGYGAFIALSLATKTTHMQTIASLIFFGGGAFILLLSYLCSRYVYQINEAMRVRTDNLRLQHAVNHDALTRVYNRNYLLTELEKIFLRARRNGPVASLCFLDIDKFKEVNDHFGHAAGDHLLIAIARLLKRRVRQTDIVARYAGDEFIIVLQDTSLEAATKVAQALIDKIAEHRFRYRLKTFNVTCSIGITEINARSKDLKSILNEADELCYVAKNAGRNQIKTAKDHGLI